MKNKANSLAETKQATVSVTRRVHIKNKANSLTETRQATVSVTRRVHIKKKANSHAEQDRPQSVSPEECTSKTRPTHCLKQGRP